MSANRKLLFVLATVIFALGIIASAGTISDAAKESGDVAKSKIIEEGIQEGSETEEIGRAHV